MRIPTLALIGALCFSLKCSAQGTLQLTFDGPPVIAPGTGVIATNYKEYGMSFNPLPNSYGFSRYGSGAPGGGPDNGTAYLSAALSQSLMFSFLDGSVFNLVSLDLAEYSAGFKEPITVHFVGYLFDGSTVTADLITDGIIDGTGPLADFQAFYFDEKWSGLARVEAPGYGWALDNLVVSVPEPSALSLLGGGVLLLAWAAKRRKRL